MNTGDIIIVSFPFANLVNFKARPAIVITTTPDPYKDVIACMISSVVPVEINKLQILLYPSSVNNLKVPSVIKVYRIVTVENNKILTAIGKLTEQELQNFKRKFISLVDYTAL